MIVKRGFPYGNLYDHNRLHRWFATILTQLNKENLWKISLYPDV